MKWGRRRKKSTTVNLRKKPDESGGTKKNLEARLPTAPLGVEIVEDHIFFIRQGHVAGPAQVKPRGRQIPDRAPEAPIRRS